MRLRTLIPPLPPNLLESLEAIGIKTIPDLLFANPPDPIFRRLQVHARLHDPTHPLHPQNASSGSGSASTSANTPLTYAELVRAIEQVRTSQAAPAVTADVDRIHELARRDASPPFACGVRDVDSLLEGIRGVIELSGGKSTGKTTLAVQTALYHLWTNEQSSCLWIDTTGTFPAEHAASILAERTWGQELPAAKTALERLHVSLAFDIEAAHDVLDNLRVSLTNAETTPRIRLVVIDTISALISPLLSAISSQGHASMTTFLRQLHALSRAFNLTILLLNGSTKINMHNTYSSFAATHSKPSLGPTFTFLTSATVWIAEAQDVLRISDESDRGAAPPVGNDATVPVSSGGDLHILEIFKARDVSSGRWCVFRLADGVVVEA